MANWLRLRRQSHAPREQDGTETIYASADGTLMHMDPDGAVSDLVGEGVLPSPTSEGDVLTVVDGDWAGEAPSGGSQAVNFYGPFVFAFDDADLDTPRELFTPPVDSFVVPIMKYLTPFDGAVPESINDAKMYRALGDTPLLPANITPGNVNAIEGDIAPLDQSGDAIVLPDFNGTTFDYDIDKPFADACFVKNAQPITAWVADTNGDPIGTVEMVTATQGEIHLLFLVLEPTLP